jgi:hypothetical protein
MTRFTHLFAALALTGGFTAATIAACASRPGAPGEVPPIAPRPSSSPSEVPAPGATTPDPGGAPPDVGVSNHPTAARGSMRIAAVWPSTAQTDPPTPDPQPAPAPPPSEPTTAPRDGGPTDAPVSPLPPSLPPVPDAKLPVPIDARGQPAVAESIAQPIAQQ